jgi:hypothetical protein
MRPVDVMDLFAAEQLNGKLWHLAKQAAFMCFLVACALLGASLVLWKPGNVGTGKAYVVQTIPVSR